MVIETTDPVRRRAPADNFTAQKLAAVDRALVDRRVSHLDYRVLSFLASATDRKTRVAKRKQKTIATALNVKTRTVQLALGRLRDLGFIIYETKEAGTYVNAYRLVLVEVSDSSALENEKTNSDSPLVLQRRISPPEKTHPRMQKEESPFVHDLPLNSPYIPYHPRELGALGSMLRQRMRDDKFDAWFGDVRIGGDTGKVGILFSSSKFRCSYVRDQFEPVILECWRSLDPLKEKIEFQVAPMPGQGCRT
jgi:hypothetical protein